MNTQIVLQLDFHPEGGLAQTLAALLEDNLGPEVSLVRRSADIDKPPARAYPSLTSDDERQRPALLILVLSQSQLARAGELLAPAAWGRAERPPVLAVVEAAAPEEMFELLKHGVLDFITPPLKALDILPRIWRALKHARERRTVEHAIKERLGSRQLIGQSPALLAETKKIPLIAGCEASVLISGETGTGKELCARAIHYLGPRAEHPFVPVNCGAIPVELVENELFGHERGAYTDAFKTQPGLVRVADGGTLFLDEVDCLPLLAQVKLLRFLQEKEYTPLGSTQARSADVRVIAASNAKTSEAVSAGRLRRDLFYRLNTIPLTLPPLRDRAEDIPMLVRHFLVTHSARLGKSGVGFSDDAMRVLNGYDWPGNVRELEHVVERALVLSERAEITAADLALNGGGDDAPPPKTFREAKSRFVTQFERSYIQELLMTHQGNITSAARTARKNRRAFWQLIRKHGIDVQSFKDAVTE
ncbi:MAG: sigma-54 dependent transcriptional regulator [Pyrinomonadaceae bacterium]